MTTAINKQGFSLVELIMAVAIFIILAVGVSGVAIRAFRSYYGAGDKFVLAEFAQEGLEAAQSIADYSWVTFKNGVGSNHGVSKNASGIWSFSGTADTLGAFTRVVTLSNVQRNGAGDIVESGGSNDPLTKKVTVTVSAIGMTDYVLSGYIVDTGYKTWEQTDWSSTTFETYWHDVGRTSSASNAVSSMPNYAFTTTTAGQLTVASTTAANLVSSTYMMGSAAKELRAVTVEQSTVAAACTLQITLQTSESDTFSSPASQVISDTSALTYTSSTNDSLNGKLYIRYQVDMSGCATASTTLYSIKIKYR